MHLHTHIDKTTGSSNTSGPESLWFWQNHSWFHIRIQGGLMKNNNLRPTKHRKKSNSTDPQSSIIKGEFYLDLFGSEGDDLKWKFLLGFIIPVVGLCGEETITKDILVGNIVGVPIDPWGV